MALQKAFEAASGVSGNYCRVRKAIGVLNRNPSEDEALSSTVVMDVFVDESARQANKQPLMTFTLEAVSGCFASTAAVYGAVKVLEVFAGSQDV